MPTCIVDDPGEGPPNQQNRTRLYATKAKKEPESYVIILKVPLHTDSKPKAGGPPMQQPDLNFPAQVDGLVEQMAASTPEEAMAVPKTKISKAITYSNNVLALARKLARQILKLPNLLKYQPFMITPDEIRRWQQLLDNLQDTPEEEPPKSEPQTEQLPQHASISHPLEKSTCFGHLPRELRLLIWKYARPDPRVVRLAWSKRSPKAPKRCSYPKYWRANYSEAPIPAMLHACAESRQVALGWYRLAFQRGQAKPRVYFDFSADILHVGCRYCDGYQCDRNCMDILNLADARRVTKLLLSFPGHKDPIHSLYLRFPFVKEILLYDSTTTPLITKTELSHLKQTIQPFDWHRGKDLYTRFLEEKASWISWGEQYKRKFGENVYKNAHLFTPEKLIRVELAVTPETSKIYGFMEKQFTGNEFLTLNSMANSSSRHTRRRKTGGRKPASSRQRTSVTILQKLDKTFLRSLLDSQSSGPRLGNTNPTSGDAEIGITAFSF